MAQESPRLKGQHEGDALPSKVVGDVPPFSPAILTTSPRSKSEATVPEEPQQPTSSRSGSDKKPEDHPDFPEDPPAEGHVNVPVRSRNQQAAHPVVSSFVASDQVSLDDDPDTVQLDRLGDSMSESSITAPPPPPVMEMPLGMEGVMDDIVGLIDQMPLDEEQDSPQSEYFFPAARMVSSASSEYNPLARPTSRWKCRWRAFAPPEEPQYTAMPVPGFVPRSSPRNRDFKNPYIKALNHTREELDKSWSLFITEESIATRMATAREDALSTMQVFEVDYNGDADVVSRLSCMPPEPCGENCRNRERLDYPVELCEIQQCEHHFDYKCQGVMAIESMGIESDMHRAGESNEVIMAPLSELRRKREDV